MLQFWLRTLQQKLRRTFERPVMRRGKNSSLLTLELLEDRINPAVSLNNLGSGLQILIAGNDTVNLSTVNGNLVIAEVSAGQTITDNTAKFAIMGSAGSQTATENAPLVADFAAITISGTGGGQNVNFYGGTFVATNVNDGTIAAVAFANAQSTFLGNLNIVTATSFAADASIAGTGVVNIIVGGTNAGLNINNNITSQAGPITLQATGAINVGTGVAVISTFGTLALAADRTISGGDDGVGTLTIGPGASIYGTSITMSGADEDIASTATVGAAVATENVANTYVDFSQNPRTPQGIAFDGSGNLYIASFNGNSISKVTPGGVLTTFCTSALLDNPYGLAFGGDGELYVSNYNNGTICRITPSGVASVFVDNTHGLSEPEGLAFDSSGNLFVSNTNSNTISEVTPTGAVSTFVNNTHGLSAPSGLVFDQGGNLYVANILTNAVNKITPAGVISTFASGSIVSNPTYLAFDGSGNLVVSTNSQIIKVTSSGTISTFIGSVANLGIPEGLAFDGSGNLYIASFQQNVIFKATPGGSVTTYIGNTGLSNPVGLAFDGSGNLYVANAGNNTIGKITPGGSYTTFVTGGQSISSPVALAFDSHSNLYIATSDNNSDIYKVTPAGVASLYVNNAQGIGQTQALALDNAGNLYIANLKTGVAKVTPAGVVSTFVSLSQGLSHPKSLAFDASGNLYISDLSLRTIFKVTPVNELSTFLPSSGNGAYGNLAFDIDGNLFATASNRIAEVYAHTTVLTTFYSGSTPLQGLAVDAGGNVYAASANNTLNTFSASLVPVTTNSLSILSSVESRPMHFGGANNAGVAGINLTSPELSRLSTMSSGSLSIGDFNQTGAIIFAGATMETTPGAVIFISQLENGPGQVVFDDTSGGLAALNGNGGNITIFAGMGGIVALNATNNSAELATTGLVSLETRGAIGSSPNRIQFADNGGNSAPPTVTVGILDKTLDVPTGVYLDSFGSLNLSTVEVAAAAPIDVVASGNVTINSASIIASFGGSFSLGADLTPSGGGDDGVGTLSVLPNATVYAATINLRGADVEIAPTAVIGNGRAIQATTLAGINGPLALAFDKSGNLFVANRDDSISEFAPGATTPTATLAGVSATPAGGAQSMTIGPDGNLFRINSGNNTVSEYARGAISPTAILTGLNGPVALACDNAGDLFVVNSNANTVSEFVPGSLTPTATLTGLSNPDALVIDVNQNVYVANLGNNTISVFASGNTNPTSSLTGSISQPVMLAADPSGNIYVANFIAGIVKFAPGATTPTAILSGLNLPSDLICDSQGDLYASFINGTVYKYTPGSTTPSASYFSGALLDPFAIAIDSSGNLFVGGFGYNIVGEFLLNGPFTTTVLVHSSMPSRPMSIGGTNDTAVAGINLTNSELATIVTAPTGSIVFGDNNQTGNITFSTATPATTPGAAVVAVESATGPGAIVLDDGAGSGVALDGDGGTINLSAGLGGIQALSAPNNVAEITNAGPVNLTSAAGLGSTQPVELMAVNNLTTDTTTANGSQFLNAIGTLNPVSLNAGGGTIIVGGSGTFSMTGTTFHATKIVDNGAVASLTVGSGQTLQGSGVAGSVTVQAGGNYGSITVVNALAEHSLAMQAGSNFNVALNATLNYSRDTIFSGGLLSLTGSNLVLGGTLTPANGQSFTIVNNFGSQPIDGTFSGLPEGAVIPNFLGSGLSATITYAGGDGNDVLVSVGSAPTTTTTLATSSASAVYGQGVTLTATVTASTTTPAGNVEFFDATTGAELGVGTLLSSGANTATWTYVTAPMQIQATGASGDLVEAMYEADAGLFGSVGSLAGGQIITPRSVTVTGITTNTKIYDHTTTATFNSGAAGLVGVFGGDVISLVASGATASFASKDVGNNIPVTLSGLTFAGPQAGNYVPIQPTIAGTITPAIAAVTGIVGANKVFDGTTSASVNTAGITLANVFSGDVVNVTVTGSTSAFTTKNAGNAVPINVTLTGLSLSGPQAADYTVAATALATADITPRSLTITANKSTKTYDGTTTTTAVPTVSGLLSGDSRDERGRSVYNPKCRFECHVECHQLHHQ